VNVVAFDDSSAVVCNTVYEFARRLGLPSKLVDGRPSCHDELGPFSLRLVRQRSWRARWVEQALGQRSLSAGVRHLAQIQ
jgi:hypothetical protein